MSSSYTYYKYEGPLFLRGEALKFIKSTCRAKSVKQAKNTFIQKFSHGFDSDLYTIDIDLIMEVDNED